MPALTQRLWYKSSTGRAQLRGVAWVHVLDHNASFLSFASQRTDKGRPSCIGNRPAQPAVLEHPLDVQAFHRDKAEATD